MDKTFKIADLLSTDIRSRANANIIRSLIDGVRGQIILDFTGVSFVSRSFTDELYNITQENRKITLTNLSDFVQTMLDAVIQGRTNKRNPLADNSEIVEFKDMESLSTFLSTI